MGHENPWAVTQSFAGWLASDQNCWSYQGFIYFLLTSSVSIGVLTGVLPSILWLTKLPDIVSFIPWK